jgi:hypothetical protein
MAALVLDGWAGRQRIPCEVIGETPKRYRIKLLQDALLPSRRQCKAGDVVLVPRYAVKLESKQSEVQS